MTFPYLGWNPAPGEPEVVRRSASELAGISEIAEDAGRTLRAISSGDDLSAWNGQAAEQFRRTLDQLCADLGLLHRSYHDASAALVTYASVLDAAQAEAHHAEAEAGSATNARDAASTRADAARSEADQNAVVANQANQRATIAGTQLTLASATANLPAAEDLLHKVQQEQRTARQATSLRNQANQRAHQAQVDRDAASTRLDAARKLGSQAQELRDDAVRNAEHALHEASANGIQPRTVLTAAMDATKEFLNSKGFDQFLTAISDVGQMLVDAALPLTVAAMGIGFAFGGGVPGMLAGAAIGNIVSLVGTGLLGLAFAGRTAQTAANPEQADKLVPAGINFGMATIGLMPGGKILKLGGKVKRSLAYADNRTLSGLSRKILWENFDVAPKPKDKFLGLIPAEPYFKVSTGIGVATMAGSVVTKTIGLDGLLESGEQLHADLTDYRPPGHGEVRSETLELVPGFARPLADDVLDWLHLGGTR